MTKQHIQSPYGTTLCGLNQTARKTWGLKTCEVCARINARADELRQQATDRAKTKLPNR
jgi:hypothetical protein